MFSLRKILLTIAFLLCAVPAWAVVPAKVQFKAAGGPPCNVTCSISFDATPTVGNFVIAAIVLNLNSSTHLTNLVSVADNQGNSYGVDFSHGVLFSSDAYTVASSSTKIATSSGTFTITYTVDFNVNFVAYIWEVSSLKASSWFDVYGTCESSFSASCAATASAPSATNNGFVIAFNISNAGIGAVDPTSGYTSDVVLSFISAASKVITASETSSATWSGSVPSGVIGAVANYKGIDAASTSPPSLMLIGVGK
jgi:hypothetical protein